MKLIKRSHCVISGKKDLELLYSFSNFPIFMGCSYNPPEKDTCIEMSWWISRSTGCVQLNPLIPADTLYKQPHGAGSIGELWKNHHIEFSKFICNYISGRNVLEIGGGHGILAKNCVQLKPNIQWTIVEPNPVIQSDSKIQIIKSLFDSKFNADKKIDTVVHSHLFEHIYNPIEFISHIARILKQGEMQLFSIPHLQVMLERKYTNCLNFEHTIFFTEPIIEYLLRRNGFIIIKKTYYLEDHSIFYATIRDDKSEYSVQLPSEYKYNRKIFMDYIHYHISLIKKFNYYMDNQKSNFFLFGGHVFSQYLLKFGLKESNIQCILDNDPTKHGKRLYGTNLIIRSPKILKGMSNPVVILRAGIYNEEIKMSIIYNINPNVIFLEG